MRRVAATIAQVRNLFRGDRNFNERSQIGATPRYDPTALIGHNSNSFVSGLLLHAGIARPANMPTGINRGYPGWQKPISSGHFIPLHTDPIDTSMHA